MGPFASAIIACSETLSARCVQIGSPASRARAYPPSETEYGAWGERPTWIVSVFSSAARLSAAKAARAALGCGQVGKAEEYAERAFEHSPDVVGYRVVRALVHKARGNVGHAITELEKARELAPDDEEASALLAKLRRSSRPQD